MAQASAHITARRFAVLPSFQPQRCSSHSFVHALQKQSRPAVACKLKRTVQKKQPSCAVLLWRTPCLRRSSTVRPGYITKLICTAGALTADAQYCISASAVQPPGARVCVSTVVRSAWVSQAFVLALCIACMAELRVGGLTAFGSCAQGCAHWSMACGSYLARGCIQWSVWHASNWTPAPLTSPLPCRVPLSLPAGAEAAEGPAGEAHQVNAVEVTTLWGHAVTPIRV